jgi:hypothetical protein
MSKSITGKSITIRFKIPVASKSLKWAANLFNVEIIQEVIEAKAPNTKISATKYIHTLPQQTIDTWNTKRHEKDGVETFKDKVGFYMKGGRDGYIYHVDDSGRVCECAYEMSGTPEYDILLYITGLKEWFLPIKKRLSESEKAEIVEGMKAWLVASKIKAFFH